MNTRELESLVRRLVEQYLARESGDKRDPNENSPAPDLRVVTESEVREAGLGATVVAAENAIVTAAADDLAKAWGVTIQRGNPERKRALKIAIASDHGGYAMKKELGTFLKTVVGMEVLDLGTHSDQTVDYPDFAHAVAEAVSLGRADLGIMIDGAGIGSSIAANKVPGIRAAMCYDAATARNSREHNFANVLTLGARMIDSTRMREIVKTFLETPTGEERHAARVRKIMEIENKYLKVTNH
jgi:ribose 5-phosphate isomerase B